MNLQEQISRIQEMMGVISEGKTRDFIFERFDNVFDKLKLIKTEEDIHQYNWINENGKKVFERNHWGTFWIYGCKEYDYMTTAPKAMEMTEDEFNVLLCMYVNKRYKEEFGEKKPVRVVGNENCEQY